MIRNITAVNTDSHFCPKLLQIYYRAFPFICFSFACLKCVLCIQVWTLCMLMQITEKRNSKRTHKMHLSVTLCPCKPSLFPPHSQAVSYITLLFKFSSFFLRFSSTQFNTTFLTPFLQVTGNNHIFSQQKITRNSWQLCCTYWLQVLNNERVPTSDPKEPCLICSLVWHNS